MLKKKTVEKSVAERSHEALGLFRSALDTLRGLNNEAEVIKQQNEEVMNKLKEENKGLDTVIKDNSNVITNISKLIGS